jgi:hypothetical protein
MRKQKFLNNLQVFMNIPLLSLEHKNLIKSEKANSKTAERIGIISISMISPLTETLEGIGAPTTSYTSKFNFSAVTSKK